MVFWAGIAKWRGWRAPGIGLRLPSGVMPGLPGFRGEVCVTGLCTGSVAPVRRREIGWAGWTSYDGEQPRGYLPPGQALPGDGMWCQMGTNIRLRMAGRGLLAAAALAGLGVLGVSYRLCK